MNTSQQSTIEDLAGYIVGTGGKGEVRTISNHVAIRCVDSSKPLFNHPIRNQTTPQTKTHDMKTENATFVHRRWRTHASVLLTSLLCLTVPAGFAPSQASAQGLEEKASAAASETKEKIEDAGKTAAGKLEQLWRRIDEARLKNRTSDEIVAWLICGLLVSGLLARTTDLRRWRPFVFGLIGAFLGGVVAHVTQLDLGLGPVLIRYEDLLFSLAGGVLVILGARRFLARKKNPT